VVKRRTCLSLWLLCVLILHTFCTRAFSYEVCRSSSPDPDPPVLRWAVDGTTYFVNTSGGPSGSLSAVQAAMQTWTDVNTSCFAFAYGGSTSSTDHGTYDGVNLVTFGIMEADGTLAENSYWYNPSTGEIVDSDIQFNISYPWSTASSPYDFDVQNVGTHEFGHSLCLADLYDAADSEKTMFGYTSPGETKQRTLDQDDIDGVSFLYPQQMQLPPVADFSASPASGAVPLIVSFTDLSANGPTSWVWDFGDGWAGAGQNPTHTYENPGIYTVSLTATNAAGYDTETKNDYITVNPCANSPVKLNTQYFNSIQLTYDSASNGDIVQVQALDFTEDLIIDRGITFTLSGGYNCDYSANPGYTTVTGCITIYSGTMDIENIIIE